MRSRNHSLLDLIVPMSLREATKNTLKSAALSLSLAAVTGFSGTEDVSLTFDDGPDPEFTPQILDVLERYDAKATFFVLGREAALYPDLIARMVAAGHAVGNHTWDHSSCLFLSAHALRQQLQATMAAVGDVHAEVFRPPFGHWNLSTAIVARSLGLDIVGWSCETDDHSMVGARHIDERIQSAMGGDIVLMHDRLAFARDPLAFNRQALIDGLAAALRACPPGRKYTTVPAMLRSHRAIRDARLFPYSTDDLCLIERQLRELMPASIRPAQSNA
jgi:peptidoglycan-N-acetylglucosamine deacetylase